MNTNVQTQNTYMRISPDENPKNLIDYIIYQQDQKSEINLKNIA